jgi:hypothetical protein
MFSNDRIKSVVAAIVLAGANLWFVLTHKSVPPATMAIVTVGLTIVASYFAPRIDYLSHKYAGAIGAVAGGVMAVVNGILSSSTPGVGVLATLSTLIVAVGSLFVPSLVRAPTTEG